MGNEVKVESAQGGGEVATLLLNHNFRPEALRPFIGKDGRSYIDNHQGMVANSEGRIVDSYGKPMLATNAATLRKDEWIFLDKVVTPVFRKRLRAVTDLQTDGLVMNLPNGMGHTVLQSQNSSDTNDADASMDGVTRSDNDRELFDQVSLPLPIMHKDFSYTAREIATSRNNGIPLDTSGAVIAARKVAEGIEKMTCGTFGTYTFAGGSVYGYENYASRLTKTMTAPTASGWTQETTYTEVLAMRQQAEAAFHYGPFMLYASTSWGQYLDAKSISTTVNQMTLRENLRSIEGINDVRTLDFLSASTMILVQMDIETVRLIDGMDITTVQWPSDGGMKLNFKVMAIQVPQIRKDYNGNTGIVHGSY